jgi:ATP-dependent Lon protease
MIVPLFVGREKSVRALEEVMKDDKQILLASQIDPTEDDPRPDGIYKSGVLANVLQLLKLPDGTVKVLVEGRRRVRSPIHRQPLLLRGEGRGADRRPGDLASVEALTRSVAEEFERYAKIKKNIPEEALAAVAETRARRSWPTLSPATSASTSSRSRNCSRRCRRRAAGEGLRPDAGRDVGPAGREEDQVAASSRRWRRRSASTISTSR